MGVDGCLFFFLKNGMVVFFTALSLSFFLSLSLSVSLSLSLSAPVLSLFSLSSSPTCLSLPRPPPQGLRGELRRARRPGGPSHGSGRRVRLAFDWGGLWGLHGDAREKGTYDNNVGGAVSCFVRGATCAYGFIVVVAAAAAAAERFSQRLTVCLCFVPEAYSISQNKSDQRHT